MATELKTIIPTILNKETHWKFQLLSNWHDIMGTLADKVHIEKIYEDTLVLGVPNSCWLQELYLLSSMVRNSINAKLDQPRIKELRFKKSGIKPPKKKNTAPYKQPTVKNVQLSPREHLALAKITDPELSAALKKFLIRCYQERE